MAEISYETMNVNGVDYPTRHAYHKAFGGEALFASNELNDILIDEDGNERFKGASALDECVYAYCDEDIIKNYTDKEFEQYVNETFD